MKETVATGESRPKIDVIENENAGYNIKARTPAIGASNETNFCWCRIPNRSAEFIETSPRLSQAYRIR
jgi:hypothetical protein